MAVLIVVALAALILTVIFVARRPYFKHTRQTSKDVSGGIHQGDPRSVSPRRDEVVEPPGDQG